MLCQSSWSLIIIRSVFIASIINNGYSDSHFDESTHTPIDEFVSSYFEFNSTDTGSDTSIAATVTMTESDTLSTTLAGEDSHATTMSTFTSSVTDTGTDTFAHTDTDTDTETNTDTDTNTQGHSEGETEDADEKDQETENENSEFEDSYDSWADFNFTSSRVYTNSAINSSYTMTFSSSNILLPNHDIGGIRFNYNKSFLIFIILLGVFACICLAWIAKISMQYVKSQKYGQNRYMITNDYETAELASINTNDENKFKFKTSCVQANNMEDDVKITMENNKNKNGKELPLAKNKHTHISSNRESSDDSDSMSDDDDVDIGAVHIHGISDRGNSNLDANNYIVNNQQEDNDNDNDNDTAGLVSGDYANNFDKTKIDV